MGAILLLAVLPLMAACGSGGSASGESSAAPESSAPESSAPESSAPETTSGEVVELKFLAQNNSPEAWAVLEGVVEGFNTEFAGKINVTVTGVDGTTYRTKAPADLRSDNPPDIAWSWAGGWAEKMVESGFAAPLDDYYAKFGWDETLSDAGIQASTFDGTKFFVPDSMSSAEWWYNADMYEANGLSVPTDWTTFLKNCETISSTDASCMLITDAGKWEAQYEWQGYFVNAFGLDNYNALLNNEIPWTDPSVVETNRVMRSWTESGLVFPGWNSIDLADGLVPWNQGKAANWFGGSWMVKYLSGDGKTEVPAFDYFPFPQVNAEHPAVPMAFADNILMISDKSQHKDEAAEFVNYYTGVAAQQAFLDSGLCCSANRGVDLSGLSPIQQRLAEDIQNAGPSFAAIDIDFDPAIADVFLTQLQGVLDGAISPEDAAAAVEAEATKVRGPVQ